MFLKHRKWLVPLSEAFDPCCKQLLSAEYVIPPSQASSWVRMLHQHLMCSFESAPLKTALNLQIKESFSSYMRQKHCCPWQRISQKEDYIFLKQEIRNLGFLLSVAHSLFSTLPHHGLTTDFFRKVNSVLFLPEANGLAMWATEKFIFMPTAQRPLSEQFKTLSYKHGANRWTKREIRSYDVKQQFLFSVYLKFILIASTRSDPTAKLERGSFN